MNLSWKNGMIKFFIKHKMLTMPILKSFEPSFGIEFLIQLIS